MAVVRLLSDCVVSSAFWNPQNNHGKSRWISSKIVLIQILYCTYYTVVSIVCLLSRESRGTFHCAPTVKFFAQSTAQFLRLLFVGSSAAAAGASPALGWVCSFLWSIGFVVRVYNVPVCITVKVNVVDKVIGGHTRL